MPVVADQNTLQNMYIYIIKELHSLIILSYNTIGCKTNHSRSDSPSITDTDDRANGWCCVWLDS